MPDQIIIDGDQVKYCKVEDYRVVSLDSFIKTLQQAHTTVRLPRNIHSIHYGGTSIYLVVEMEPGIHLIKTDTMRTGVHVGMPWQYFVFEFVYRENNVPLDNWKLNDYRLFWADSRLEDLDEKILIAALVPNVYQSSGQICFGVTAPESSMSVADRVNTIVNEFYSPVSIFNEDLEKNLPPSYTSFLAWARDTQKNGPNCWRNWALWTDDPYYGGYRRKRMQDFLNGLQLERTKPNYVDIDLLPVNDAVRALSRKLMDKQEHPEFVEPVEEPVDISEFVEEVEIHFVSPDPEEDEESEVHPVSPRWNASERRWEYWNRRHRVWELSGHLTLEGTDVPR